MKKEPVTEIQCIWNAKAELGEGVFWHPTESAVYWVDIILSRLHRLSKNGERRSWDFPGRASAVVPCSTGGLLATFENGVFRIDLDPETVTLLLPLEEDQRTNRFNDGYTDTLGQFWFGSMDDQQLQPSGRFYRLDLTGQVHCIEQFGEICITNGPAFSTEGNWIFFTDTLKGKIFRAPLNLQGEPGEPELFIDFAPLPGHPDGMCTDTTGGLWVCHFAGARVTRFTAEGRVDHIVHMPVPNITKCAFGKEGMRTLFITTAATGLDPQQRQQYPLAGGLFSVEVPYQGVPVNSAAYHRAE